MNLDNIHQYEPDIRLEDIDAVTNYLKSEGFSLNIKKQGNSSI